jgi:hypothetical protein
MQWTARGEAMREEDCGQRKKMTCGAHLSAGERREVGVLLQAVLLGLGRDRELGRIGARGPLSLFFVLYFPFSVFSFNSQLFQNSFKILQTNF